VGSYALAVRQLTPGGLAADFFDNQWLQGTPVVSRVAETVDFAWGTGLITPYGRDYVSIRFQGKVVAPSTEIYTLIVDADEGVRMWWNHTLVRGIQAPIPSPFAPPPHPLSFSSRAPPIRSSAQHVRRRPFSVMT
jgi:hypothetical protein